MFNLLISLLLLLPPGTSSMERLSPEQLENEFNKDQLALSFSCGMDEDGLPYELEMEQDKGEPLECDCPKSNIQIYASKKHSQPEVHEVDFAYVIDFLEDKDLKITEYNVYRKENQLHFIFKSLNDEEEVIIWRYTKS